MAGGTMDRRQRKEESGAKVSRDPVREKRKSSTSHLHRVKNDQHSPDGGDISAEQGKKQKDREEGSATADRWVGGGEEDIVADIGPKEEAVGAVDTEKAARLKLSSVDLKGRSSRRCEGSAKMYEETGGNVESVKHRSEKDSSRRETSGKYKEAKERGREHGSERYKNVRDSSHEWSDDPSSRNRGAETAGSEADEWHIQDELRNPELEKELEKRIRRRDGSGDKWQGDGRESDDRWRRESNDRWLSSRGDRTKNGSYRDEKHKYDRNRDRRYNRDKYWEDLDRDHRHRDDRHRDERSSRDHASNSYDGKHIKDDKFLESRPKKSKLQNSDHDGGSYVEDQGTKFKDIRGRKRSSENEEHRDLKLRNTKQPHGDVEKSASDTCKLDAHMDRIRSEYRHPAKVDSSFSDNLPKSLPSSSSHVVKDQSRCSSKQGESTQRESLSQERRISAASKVDRDSASGVRKRDSVSWSWEKTKPKDHPNSGESLTEIAAAPQYDRTPRSDGHISPIKLTEKSTSMSDRLGSNKCGARHSLDIEDTRQISSTPKDGRDCSTIDRVCVDNHSQTDMQNSELIPVGSSSFIRAAHFFGNSPGHLPAPPPARPRIDSPVLGSFEDDNRYQTGDHKPSSRYKRNGDYNTGRAQGNAWRSTSPWPPVANGFIPFQHSPPPPGFHSAIQQFPAPPLFGIRPSMDMNPTGVSYHVHEASDRFSGHGRSFGWYNPLDDSCPHHLQGWDGSSSVFGDESHVYGRPEWDQNRHLIRSRGWEVNAGMWKGQNGNVNREFPVPQNEPEYTPGALTEDAWVGQSDHVSHTERACWERVPEEKKIKQSNDTPSATKHAVETPPKIHEKITEPSKTPIDDSARIFCTYLSKLDISLGLTCPELYKQCMTLLGTSYPPGDCNFSKHQCPQNDKEDGKAAAKSSNHILNSLFP